MFLQSRHRFIYKQINSPIVQFDQFVGFFRLALGFYAQRLRIKRQNVFELIGGTLDEKRGGVHCILERRPARWMLACCFSKKKKTVVVVVLVLLVCVSSESFER